MQFGIALPHFGPTAGLDAIVKVAEKAEELGFDSVWTLDRLLWPLQPTSRYPGNPRGELSPVMQTTYDPLTVLAFVAARTRKVRLGTSVLVASFRSPVVLAKMVATLDVLSGGRFILGLGAGWSSDEFTAVNQCMTDRHERMDEFLKLLKLLWTEAEPCFEGKFYRIPRSIFLPKPVQKPHPPIWLGGNSRPALRRAALFGNGWHPTKRLGPAGMAKGRTYLRGLAQKEGRDPDAIALTLRWNNLPDINDNRGLQQMAQGLRDFQNAGLRHVCFDLNIPRSTSLSAMFGMMESLMHEVKPVL
ncbi:MAG: LLM class F420-dependent oxidoreductase [Candidatus Binatia bacterium]